MDVDVVIVEVGGTVGDIESLPFLEAIRQIRLDVKDATTCFCSRHAGSVDRVRRRRLKTKPTQHSVEGITRDRHRAGHSRLPV